MRIAIDARTIADHFPGIGRYTYNLIHALGQLAPQHQLLVIHNPALHNTRFDLVDLAALPGVTLVACRAAPFSPAEHVVIPRLLRKLHADIYHAPYYVRPYVALPCPAVVTLYDAIPRLFPRDVSLRARLLFDLLTRLAIRTSRHVLTISNSARDDLVAAYRLDPGCVTVTPLAADARFQPQAAEAVTAMRARYRLPERYLLTLGSNKPHKNLPLLLEAWNRVLAVERLTPMPCLVVAGHREASAASQEAPGGSNVRLLDNIPDADLPALYAGATPFVFPSRYEGFGLPPLEAMACATPVLCGAVSSLPEVVGDAALQVDVTNVEALAEGLRRLLEDEGLRQELQARGIRRAADFSWRRTAEQTLKVYKQVLAEA